MRCISLIAVIFCLLVIHSNANRGKSPGKGKYYLVKTKDSSDDEMPMAPEEDQDEVSAIPVPDHTVDPQALEELDKIINPQDLLELDKLINENGNIEDGEGEDYVVMRKRKGLKTKAI